ncbi:MAG TPA: MlaD family protein [Vicinamibacterales bacterium]|jgi:phospholipid/cholesterol/gamma-HCH transport system substrate-binding protein
MISPKAVGAGAFVVIGLLLFAAGLFLIGERRGLFERRFTVYTELSRLGELETGAPVRVAGADAGEVTDIQVPRTPSEKFRVKMEVREKLHPIVRTDSVAVPQTEGLVGGVFLNIAAGTDQAPRVADGGTIPGRDPFHISDLLEQASNTMMMIGDTVMTLRGDAERAVHEVAGTAEDAHALLDQIRPDLEAMAKNGNVISNDTREIVAKLNDGQGTIGKLVNDDELYRQFQDLTTKAQVTVDNLHQVSDEARRAVVDFRSKDGPAQGLLADMRTTIGQAREATADLADNMEAMKHNFLLRGFFTKRGYYNLDSISPVEYRTGVLENGKRKAMRIWLKSEVLFEPGPDGTEVLSEGGRARIDSAMSTYLKYLPASPLVVEGYAPATTVAERFRVSRRRAGIVRQYILGKYEVPPQNAGFIGLGEEAFNSPDKDRWDGVALTLFLDRTELGVAKSQNPNPKTQIPTSTR